MPRLTAIAISLLAGSSLWAGGFGLGLQTAVDLGGGSAIVPRLDYLYVTDTASGAGPYSTVNLSATANIITVGADYDYYFSGRTGRGFYLLAGAGVAFANLDVSGSDAYASSSTTSSQTLLYPEAGAGWQFNRHIGVELLYKALNFKDVDLVVDNLPVVYSLSGGLQAGVVFRF